MKCKFSLSLLVLFTSILPGWAVESPCAKWLIHQDRWAKDREGFQIIPAHSGAWENAFSADEYARYVRQISTAGNLSENYLTTAHRLISLAEEYLSFYGVAYELWRPLKGEDFRLHLLPGEQSALNKAVRKIEDRYGLQVFYAPAKSIYQQKLVWVDEESRALYLGHQNLIDQLQYADFPLFHQVVKLEIERQYAQGKDQIFWGTIATHGHGVRRLFEDLKTEDDYFSVDWADIFATWRELAVLAKNLSRGRGVDGHKWTSSAEEEITFLQQKIDSLKTQYNFIELTYKNMLAPFLKWYWPRIWRITSWRQAFKAHNLNSLKRWPAPAMQDMQEALAQKVVLATAVDMLGHERLEALFSFSHEGKRWTTIRIPLDETKLGPGLQLEQIKRIPAVKTAAQNLAAQQFLRQMQVLFLLQGTLSFLNQADAATNIYFNYHNARQEFIQLAQQVQAWNEADYLAKFLVAKQGLEKTENKIKNKNRK